MHFFDFHYVEPKKRGQAGYIDFTINRFFIPRSESFLWHPAKLCQSLKLPTSRLLFWYLATSIPKKDWRPDDFYRWVYRLEHDIDKEKLWRWEKRQLTPALAELEEHGFQNQRGKNGYGEDVITTWWPKVKAATRGNEWRKSKAMNVCLEGTPNWKAINTPREAGDRAASHFP